MFSKSSFFALAIAGCLLAAAPSLARDPGVSGIPRGPGSVGGINNSINDPSGIGNGGRIAPPPPPSMAVPVVPTYNAPVSSRASSRVSRSAPIVRRADREPVSTSRRGSRRSSARAARSREKQIDFRSSASAAAGQGAPAGPAFFLGGAQGRR